MAPHKIRDFDVSGRLMIDLAALVANYRALRAVAAPADVGGVVKADAYGLGAAPISRALVEAGCRHLFVAQLDEALSLRMVVPGEVSIYVLNGLWPGSEATAAEAGIVPVLNSRPQVEAFRNAALARRERLPAVLQLDTGMSRLGLTEDEVEWIAGHPDVFGRLDVRYVMTHLACADHQLSAASAAQRLTFHRLLEGLPPRAMSIANSAALQDSYRGRFGDLSRVGLALYGGAAVSGAANAMRPVVRLTARVIQVREVPAGTGVGYGLTYVTAQPSRLATIAAGYADGWPRALSNRGGVYRGGHRLPIVGRISMDSMTVDASALEPGALAAGDEVELIGPNQTLEDVAGQAGTISYEILTRLGARFRRDYQRSAAAPSKDI